MSQTDDFAALFAAETDQADDEAGAPPWKVLLVDDEPDIHAVLHLALQDVRVEGRPLRLLDARSADAARALLAEHPDIALILLDVVMETERAGLELVRHVRRERGDARIQIVLVTGQPGYAPQREVVVDYEINGYRLKSELTTEKIFVSVYSALRAYRTLDLLEQQRRDLEDLAAALREGQERLRAVVDTAPDAIILANSQGLVTGWNPGAQALFGYPAGEIIGQPLARLMPERHRARHTTAFDSLSTGSDSRLLGRIVEVEALRRDGSEFPAEIVLGSWMAPEGRHFSAVLRDVSARKREEAELERHRHHLEVLVRERTAEIEQSNARLRQTQFAMDRAGIGIAWSEVGSGRFLYANDEACRQLGYPAEELLRLGVSDISPELPMEAFRRVVDGLKAGGCKLRIETHHRRKDGSTYPVEVTLYLPEAPGETHCIAFYQDITERKRSEAELIQARDDAQAASRAKSTFLANMSHELRTPMNAIMGMTTLALRHAEDPRLRDQLGKIDHASRHLLHIINDILDISRIEAERLTLEAAPFRLGQVFDDLFALMGDKAAEQGIRLITDLPAELAAQDLLGDATRLGQILLNLAGNAIKFTHQGSVTLRARVVEEQPGSLLLRCEVRDTGIGISADDQKRLFSAFEQAGASLTRKYGGTGLGLAISKRLAAMMGGEIGVESSPGAGSLFWFTARLVKGTAPPRAGAPDAGATAATHVRARHGGARVLLAEDEPVSQEVSRWLLEGVGLNVDVAADGQAALDLSRRNRYALILMDMQMPKVNGLEATRAIRADSPNRDTPILAMTANAFDEDRQACLEAGMNGHVVKPIEPERLYADMLTWLDGGR